MQTLAEFYTERNVLFLKQWLELTKSGVRTREASKIVAENNAVSSALITALVYNKNYSYAAEAWDVIHREEAESEKKAKAKQAAKKAGA